MQKLPDFNFTNPELERVQFISDDMITQAIKEEYLSLEVTTKCNSTCAHCFARAGVVEQCSLDKQTVLSILKEGFDLGYRMFHISGGEPLLWPHLTWLLDKAFKMGYVSAFCNTNGSLLTKERCKKFAEYGDRLKFSISLQGSEKLHDLIRGRGAYTQAITGIGNALDAGIKVNLFTSAGKSLIQELPEFTSSILSDFPGIEYFTLIQLIRVHNDKFDLSDELLDPESFIRLFKTASMLSLYGIKLSILENPLINVLGDMLDTKWLPPERPISRPGRAVIMADGNITIYHSSRDSFGIYKPGMLNKVLFSEDYKKAVRVDCTDCGDCPYLERCAKNGMKGPSEWFRSIHQDIPFCRRVLDEADKE